MSNNISLEIHRDDLTAHLQCYQYPQMILGLEELEWLADIITVAIKELYMEKERKNEM